MTRWPCCPRCPVAEVAVRSRRPRGPRRPSPGARPSAWPRCSPGGPVASRSTTTSTVPTSASGSCGSSASAAALASARRPSPVVYSADRRPRRVPGGPLLAAAGSPRQPVPRRADRRRHRAVGAGRAVGGGHGACWRRSVRRSSPASSPPTAREAPFVGDGLHAPVRPVRRPGRRGADAVLPGRHRRGRRLIIFVSVYEMGDYLVGSGLEERRRGPAGGVHGHRRVRLRRSGSSPSCRSRRTRS